MNVLRGFSPSGYALLHQLRISRGIILLLLMLLTLKTSTATGQPTTAMPTTTVRPTQDPRSPGCNGSKILRTTCERNYVKVGAFKDNVYHRVLPVLLLTDRDCSSKKSDGHKIDWHKFNDSIHSLACRCAALVKERGWKVFGLQYYGECWSGPSVDLNFTNFEEVSDSSAAQFIGNPLPPCDPSDPQECVGKESVNYVYRLGRKEFFERRGSSSYSANACGGGRVANIFVVGDRYDLIRKYPVTGHAWLDPYSCRDTYGTEPCCIIHRGYTLRHSCTAAHGSYPYLCERGPYY